MNSQIYENKQNKTPDPVRTGDAFRRVARSPCAVSRRARNRIGAVEEPVLRQALDAAVDAEFYAPLRRAANEAAAVAWMTPFPLLFLPSLFEEKVAAVRRQVERAQNVRTRSRRILEEVS